MEEYSQATKIKKEEGVDNNIKIISENSQIQKNEANDEQSISQVDSKPVSVKVQQPFSLSQPEPFKIIKPTQNSPTQEKYASIQKNESISKPQQKPVQQQQIHKEKIIISEQQSNKQPLQKKEQSLKVAEDKNTQPFISLTLDTKNLELIKEPEIIIPQQQQVKIEIKQTVQKGNALNKYSLYHIVGKDMHGYFEVRRKFTEFSSLRKILMQRWPGCFIPSITNKSEVKSASQKQKSIQRILCQFLIGLSYTKHIYYKEEVTLFLRSPDVQISQMFDKMPVLKTPDVINRFKSSYGEQIDNPSNPKNMEIISNFGTSLRKIINNLGQLSRRTINLAESYDGYMINMMKFGEAMRMYQQFSLAQFTQNNRQKTILVKDDTNKIEKIKIIHSQNPFYQLYNLIQLQARDAQSFLEVIIAIQLFTMKRDQLQVKIKEIRLEIDQIALGHKTMRTMTTRKNKEDVQKQLQQEQKQLMEEKFVIVQLYNIIEIVLAQKQIQIFKKIKKNYYHSILKKWIILTGTQNPQLQTVWRFINDEAMIMMKNT